MNIFSGLCCSQNSGLWILILLLIAASASGESVERALSGASTPILIALLYTMWKNGTLSSIFCGNGSGCNCNCS